MLAAGLLGAVSMGIVVGEKTSRPEISKEMSDHPQEGAV
jgi:hypothetical protein